MANVLSIYTQRNIQSKKWQKAFTQGYKAGLEDLDVKFAQSPTYRYPKAANTPWQAGYAQGALDRESESAKGKP